MTVRVLRALERELPGVRVRTMVAAAALIALASAWFNQGFFSHDEHFQIIEFAWHKLGRTPADGLAWEFAARMRPGIQPWLAAGLFRGLDAIGWFTPFFATFLLRLASGLLGLWVSLELCLRVLPWVRDAALRRVLLAGMLFLWFLPYAHGRFASENWGGLLFFAGLCPLLDAIDPARGRALLRAGAAGLLWSAAFYARFQVAFAIAGVGLWLLLIARARPALIATLGAAFLAGCGANTVLDRWLYDEWVWTPYNYFYMNIVQGKAASFGTEPWWFYFGQIVGLLVPPFSLLLVALIGASFWWSRRNVLVWAAVPFLIGHTIVGHKETRFIIPMTYALVPLIVLGADRLPEALRATLFAWSKRRAAVVAAWVFVVLNGVGLAVMTFKPSSETAVIYSRLYEESLKGPIVLYSASELPYAMGADAVDFYQPAGITFKRLRDIGELHGALDGSHARIFMFQQALRAPAWLSAEHIGCSPVARSIPTWAAQFNVNDWTSRMYRWSVFWITPPPGAGGC